MKKSIDDHSTDRATLEKWAQSMDAAAHKQLSTVAHGLSPISLGLAYADWLAHLSASPGSQSLRMIDAWQSYLRAMEKNVQLTTQPVTADEPDNGASLCATTQHESRATTMGFSAVDGLMMGTRSGALDPGVLLFLLEQGWDHDAIEKLIYKQSGLLGVSGESADMRVLSTSNSQAARFAIELFTHRVVRDIGALTACIEGLDVLAFTGGIGEHDAECRAKVGQSLAYLGVSIDSARNLRATGDTVQPIHSDSSSVEVWVIPTDEGRVSAQEALALL